MKTSTDVLTQIIYMIKVLNYMVNMPAPNYQYHMTATQLVIDELDRLEKVYRKLSDNDDFRWTSIQHTVKKEKA